MEDIKKKSEPSWLLVFLTMLVTVVLIVTGLIYTGKKLYETFTGDQSPFSGKEKKKAKTVLGKMVLCQKIYRNKPQGVKNVFTHRQNVYVFLPIIKKGNHKIRVEFSPESKQVPPVNVTLKTHSSWVFCYLVLPPRSRGPFGKWTAKVYVNNQLHRQAAFSIIRQ